MEKPRIEDFKELYSMHFKNSTEKVFCVNEQKYQAARDNYIDHLEAELRLRETHVWAKDKIIKDLKSTLYSDKQLKKAFEDAEIPNETGETIYNPSNYLTYKEEQEQENGE